MKLSEINRMLQWLTENKFLVLVATLTSILSYFTFFPKCVKRMLDLMGFSAPDEIVDVLTFCVSFLLVFAVYWITRSIGARTYRRIAGIYVGNVRSGIWPDGAGDRIREFQELRSKANESILGMGIGMTYFSHDATHLKNLLDKGLRVRLIMINPDIIGKSTLSSGERQHSITIRKDLFDEYFCRPGYSRDVRTSYERLIRLITARQADNNRKGYVELRSYPYLIPMNITIIDESNKKGHGELLLEWCLAFSDLRVHTRLSQSTDRQIFEAIKSNTEELWKRSEKVIADDS